MNMIISSRELNDIWQPFIRTWNKHILTAAHVNIIMICLRLTLEMLVNIISESCKCHEPAWTRTIQNLVTECSRRDGGWVILSVSWRCYTHIWIYHTSGFLSFRALNVECAEPTFWERSTHGATKEVVLSICSKTLGCKGGGNGILEWYM